MSWNGLTATSHAIYVNSHRPAFAVMDEDIQVKVTAKNPKAGKILIEHGNTFMILKLTSVGQYMKATNSYYKKGGVFSWQGWLYDIDIHYAERTDLRMKYLK